MPTAAAGIFTLARDASTRPIVRGSNALTGGVDVVTEVERLTRGEEELDPDARMLKSLSRYEETPAELGIRLSNEGYEATDREALRMGR